MRIRSTKPEFWRSRTVASVDWDARFILKGLESYVDDNGVGKDDVALIVGDVFPRDMLANPRETVARVSEAISSLYQAGLVWRYEVAGTPLLYISNWESIQRIDKPGRGRLPRPDGTMDFKESTIRESVASPRESVAPGTGEQGNRGTGEKELVGNTSHHARVKIAPDESPHRCQQHRWTQSPPPCQDCQEVRESSVDHKAAAAARRREELDAAAAAERTEIDHCGLCDERGYRNRRVCSHDPTEDERRNRGIAEVRSVLAEKGIA